MQPQMQMPAGMGIPMLQSIPGLSHHQQQPQPQHPGFAGMMMPPGMGMMSGMMHQPPQHPGFAGLPQLPAGMVLPAAMTATPQQLGVGMAMSGSGGSGLVGSHQSDLLNAKPSPAPKFKKAPDAPKVC
jgi:hypothetical protein